jgi:WD40 repeat protein
VTAAADGTVKIWRHQTVGGSGLREEAVARGAWGEARALALATNADATWVAAGYAGGQIRFWELTEPRERALLTRGNRQAAAFVGGGRRLVNGVLHDFSKGWQGPTQRFPTEPIRALTVHPRGRWFAFGDQSGALAIGDLQRPGEVVTCGAGHRQPIDALAASPDGKDLASASADGTVKLWTWEGGDSTRTLEPGLGPLRGLAWAHDSRNLTMVGVYGMSVFDREGPPTCRLIRKHFLPTCALAQFANLVAVSGPDGTIDVRDHDSDVNLYTLRGHTAAVSALEFSPDGKLLASAATDGSVRLWEMTTGSEWAVFKNTPFPLMGTWLAFDLKGRYLASNSTHATLIWDLRSKTPAAQLMNSQGRGGQFTVDGSAVLAGTSAGSIQLCSVGAIERARAAAQGPAKLPPSTFVTVQPHSTIVKAGHTGEVWGIATSPDGRWIATASHDLTVKLWDAQTMKLVRTLEGHRGVVWSVAFSPDSKYLASSSAEPGSGTVKVWEVATGRQHRHFRGHQQLVVGLAFHPSRPLLASSSLDGSVFLWDLEGGKSVGQVHQFGQAVYSVAFRPDGRWLAAACLDSHVALWDLTKVPSCATPPSQLLKGHTTGVYAVGFSADGRYLASGAEQGVIMLWDAQSFAPLTTLRGGTGQIRCVTFSRDGQLLAGAAYVAPTIVWDLNRLRRTLADMNLDW